MADLNPIRMLWDVFYGMASSLTGIVGLTPLQLLGGIVGLVLLGILSQVGLALAGKQGWTLEDKRNG